MKKILVIADKGNSVYSSQTEAAKALGVNAQNVYKAMKTGKPVFGIKPDVYVDELFEGEEHDGE